MSKILASQTPFSIGGNTRPPPGPQGVSLTGPNAPYSLALVSAVNPAVMVGASSPTAGLTTNLLLDGFSYPVEAFPGSPVTNQQAHIVSSMNCNAGFDNAAQEYSITCSFFTEDGETPINCVAPIPDPGAVAGHIFELNYSQALSVDGSLAPVAQFCPPLLPTTRNASINFTLAAQTAESGAPNRYVFLPALNPFVVGGLAGFIIQWDTALTDASGSYRVLNYRQFYRWIS